MPIQNPLTESSVAFPVIESIHLLAILCALGTAALMNLRLLGIGMVRDRPSQLWSSSLLLTLIGFTVAILSGLLLFSIDPEAYLGNQAFRWKMAALATALIFYYTVVRWAAVRDRQAPVIALISLGLYALVPLGGILIGYES